MPPAEVLAEPSRSNASLYYNPQPSHRKRSITMTTVSGIAQHSKLAAALTTPETRTRRNSTTAETAKRRFSAMMLRRPSQSTSASSSSSSSDQKSISSTMSRRQSLTRATASSLAKVVPSFHNKNTNTESSKPSPNNGIHLLARRRSSVMALSNPSQPSTPKPSGSTVVKSSSSSTGSSAGKSSGGSKWFGLRRPSSPAVSSASTSSSKPAPRPRRYSMIPQTPASKAAQNHMPQDKHDTKLASLAKQPPPQQRRMSAVQLVNDTPDRSISNLSTLKQQHKPNLPARHGAAADKPATAGAASVALANAACAEPSAAQDSYFEQHHPTETPRNKPAETCSRLSPRMLDSDISASSIESRRSSVSSVRNGQQQGNCRHNNNTTQHPAWLASAGFMRRTKCTACNPSEHRRCLSRSSSMYDVAAAAQQASSLRRLSRASLTEDNGAMKTNNRRIASADGAFDPPLTPIPNTTAVFIRQQQQQQQRAMPTAAATAAAAMAAAAAVVSAAAATAASINPDTSNEKWMRLIGNCVTHSNKIERIAQELMSSEQCATHIFETQASMEDMLKSRDEEYQYQVQECEALVRVQREMLDEMESLLGNHGFKKEINANHGQHHDLNTPPPSSPSASSSSSSSMMMMMQEQPAEHETEEMASEEAAPSERLASVDDAEAPEQESVRELTASPEPLEEEPVKEEASVADKSWNEKMEEGISQFRWSVSQWVGGGVGTGQIVKCELGPDGLMSTIIVAGTGVTTEPRLLPKHLMQPRSDKSVYYHQYILYIERDDRNDRFSLMPSPQWIQDKQVKRCQFSYSDAAGHIKCTSGFDWLARRHHCRRCGHIFCNTHSSNTLPLFDGHSSKAEWSRVCDTCFYDLAGASLFHPSDDR